MGRWDDPNRKVPSIFLTHNKDIPKKEEKKENNLILDSSNREKSYYAQIDDFPYYIHNNKDNFNLTAKEINEKDVSTSFKESEFIKKFLAAQILREDKLLISLFGNKNVDITKEFEKSGFILPQNIIIKIINELNKLKNNTDFSNDLKKIAEGKTDLKYEAILSNGKLDTNKFKTELEKEWNNYVDTVNNITENLDKILGEIKESTASLPSLVKEIKKLQKLANKETPQETIITELHKINGRVSNYYKNITEGYNIITKDMILNNISGNFSNGTVTIMGEADAYRAGGNKIKDAKKAKTYSKSDMIIVLKQNNLIIPLGGISVKKTDSSTKFHNTTSLSALLDSLKETEIMYENFEHDKNLFKYTGINKLMQPDSNSVSDIFNYIARKYGVIFVMGGIANTILDNPGNEKDSAASLPGTSVFKSEHADFLYKVSATKGTSEVIRMSKEIENLYSELKMTINYKNQSIGKQKRENDLEKLRIEKNKVEHYTYGNFDQNDEIKRLMLDMYKEHSKNLDARIIVG